jgi:4-oxalocrotonate tautomerase
MPVISITLGVGQTSPEQKKQLVESFTTQAVEITRIPAQSFTILINELNPDSIGVGGRVLTDILKERTS